MMTFSQNENSHDNENRLRKLHPIMTTRTQIPSVNWLLYMFCGFTLAAYSRAFYIYCRWCTEMIVIALEIEKNSYYSQHTFCEFANNISCIYDICCKSPTVSMSYQGVSDSCGLGREVTHPGGHGSPFERHTITGISQVRKEKRCCQIYCTNISH